MLYITQGNHYCLMALTPGLRNKEVYLMCQWVLMMELTCASSGAYICYIYYLEGTTKTILDFIVILDIYRNPLYASGGARPLEPAFDRARK